MEDKINVTKNKYEIYLQSLGTKDPSHLRMTKHFHLSYRHPNEGGIFSLLRSLVPRDDCVVCEAEVGVRSVPF